MTNTDIVESTSGHRLSHFAVNVFSAEQDITAVIQKLSPAVEVKGRVRDKRFYASLDRLMAQVGRGYIDTQ